MGFEAKDDSLYYYPAGSCCSCSGVAPTHAEFQRFFDLTPPSVNSMLIRLEWRGFIRRVPHQARAIELTINPDWIPPLDRPFRL